MDALRVAVCTPKPVDGDPLCGEVPRIPDDDSPVVIECETGVFGAGMGIGADVAAGLGEVIFFGADEEGRRAAVPVLPKAGGGTCDSRSGVLGLDASFDLRRCPAED